MLVLDVLVGRPEDAFVVLLLSARYPDDFHAGAAFRLQAGAAGRIIARGAGLWLCSARAALRLGTGAALRLRRWRRHFCKTSNSHYGP